MAMRFAPEQAENRREFFRSTTRYGLLALLAAAASLAARKPALRGQSCVNRGLCNSCGAFAGCGLPAALSAKQSTARQT